ncbi:GIY-YIG nuclease family protein [Wenyingzhuangia sp. chi5]|uniref:GIY-YIG nuclease family protein n=1 Tax=Wenyingzhuangia gilva TaxID=3057677 RepID=A0ABT8VRK7_9FLAO|nr:GIY-YIG nuclease family protein [Wenyingzhuangia sp. chi5]MDO3694608.1 GIY-YIG nuclease family protein [Wenyingzhuangia sp. chi5]
MHFLYILYSKKLNKFYIGETANMTNRLTLHMNKTYYQSFTSKADDWKVLLEYQTNSKENAMYLERFIKRMKSKKFIQKIIDDKSILNDILTKK